MFLYDACAFATTLRQTDTPEDLNTHSRAEVVEWVLTVLFLVAYDGTDSQHPLHKKCKSLLLLWGTAFMMEATLRHVSKMTWQTYRQK